MLKLLSRSPTNQFGAPCLRSNSQGHESSENLKNKIELHKTNCSHGNGVKKWTLHAIPMFCTAQETRGRTAGRTYSAVRPPVIFFVICGGKTQRGTGAV